MTPTLRIVAIWMALLLPAGHLAVAAELTIDPVRQLQFARELREKGQYRRAAEEFQRFAYFFSDHPERRPALLESGKSFLQAADPQSAQMPLKTLIDDGQFDDIGVETHFLLAETYLRLGARTHAVVTLNNLIALCRDPSVEDRAYHRIGWIQIEATDWQGALRAFQHLSPAGRQRYRISSLESSLGRSGDLAYKSPALAGTLSIVPGAGQLYCRRYKDAAVAFVLGVGPLWASTEAFDKDQPVLGGLLAVIGLGFYTGNIYGAVNDAHKFNAEQQRRFIDELRRSHLSAGPMSSPEENRELLIGLRFSF